MDPRESDEQAMARLAGGDGSALDTLMARWQRQVLYYVHRLCDRGVAAEDICQDVWMRLYRYRANYDGGGAKRPFATYLFAIATNCCRTRGARDSARRSRERGFSETDGGGDAAARVLSDRPCPMDSLISREESRQLHEAISALPDAQRAVVLLYLLCSADYDQIAQVLDRKPGTVRSHMHHALRKLRGALRTLSCVPGKPGGI